MALAIESGIKDLYVGYRKETATGDFAGFAKDWDIYGSAVVNFKWAPSAPPYEQRVVGDTDPRNFFYGPETHDVTVEMDLDSPLVVNDKLDTAKQPSPRMHGFLRENDGSLATYSIISRQSLVTGGALGKGIDIYSVIWGARPNTTMISGDPATGQPMRFKIDYKAETGRSYVASKLAAGYTLQIAFAEPNQDVSGSGEAREAVTVKVGTMNAAGVISEKSKDIAAGNAAITDLTGATADGDSVVHFYLSASTANDVVLLAKKTGEDTVQICRILGSKSLHGGDATAAGAAFVGDMGIPDIRPEGQPNTWDSDQSKLGLTTYKPFLYAKKADLGKPNFVFVKGSKLQRSLELPTEIDNINDYNDIEGSETDPATISSFELTVENNVQEYPNMDSRSQRYVEGERKISAKVTIFSSKGSHQALIEHLSAVHQSVWWANSQGYMVILDAVLTEVGARNYSPGDAVMSRDNTFVSKGVGIGIGNLPIQPRVEGTKTAAAAYFERIPA